MKKLIPIILSLIFVIAIISCSDETDPQFRIHNERADKANVQLQTSGGNTVNINDVGAGQSTAYQTVAVGIITATAVIQNESVSPAVTFSTAKDTRYTIVIRTGNPPVLRVDQE